MCMSCQLQQLLQTSNRFIHKTMSIGIGDNFNYQGSKFNMDRDSFQTKEAMKNYPETSLPPKGFRTYCAEDDEYYEFNAGNSVDPDTGKWRMVDNPTAKKTVEDAKTNGDYAKEQGDAAKEAARKVTNDVLFKVFQSLTEDEQTQVKQNIGIGVEQKFQGQFESYSELEGVSSPAVGDYAYVGNPRNLYAYKSSGWVNLGEFNYNIDQELDAGSERGISNGVVTKKFDNIESHISKSSRLAQKPMVTENMESYFDYSKFTSIKIATENKGYFPFGSTIDAEISNSHRAIFKATITLQDINQPLWILIKGATAANIPYRSFAVYDSNGGILREGNSNGDILLHIYCSVTIIATCEDILVADASNVKTYKGIPNGTSLYEEIKVLKDNAQFDRKGQIILQNNDYIDYSKLRQIDYAEGDNPEGGAIYKYGDAIDAEAITGGKLRKGKIVLDRYSAQSRLVLLKQLRGWNLPYRSFAIYDENNNILKEGCQTGDLLLQINCSCTIVANCEEIYSGNNVYGGCKTSLYEEIKALKEKETTPLPLTGISVWTLWDSLGHNTWQSHFKEISGATFYEELNVKSDKPLSWGGTNSDPATDDGTQARALNLVSYKDADDYAFDVILIENVNDRNISNIGSISDASFMRSQKIMHMPSNELISYSLANIYVTDNMATILNGVSFENRKRGTIISVPYTSGSSIRGSKITFTHTPTQEGDISINLNGEKSVHVTTDMTIQDIVNKFLQYSWGAGWTDIDAGNGAISIFYYTETSIRATFNGNDTGVTATVEDTVGTGAINLYFTSDNVNDWDTAEKWVRSVSLYSVYKGLVEFLQKELPQALIYFVAPYAVSVDFSQNTYKYADGTWSQDKFKASDIFIKQKNIYDVQKEVCEYYNIGYLDLVNNAGMNIVNIEEYFYTNNIHPKQIGYNRYAETICKLLIT